jgi:hypothetical protein
MESTMSLAHELYRVEPADAGPFASAAADAKRLIPTGGRFQVNEAVMAAVERMERNGFWQLLALLPKARLPFPTTWIEWPQPGGGGNIGYLCEALEGEGFAFRQYLNFKAMTEKTGFPFIATFGRIRVELSGWSAEDPVDARSAGAETGVSFLERAAADILGLLLIIDSPSRVLQIADGADNARIDAKRARKGRPPLVNLRQIQFDVARFQQALPVGTLLKTQAEVGEHFVRGHFKQRETGLFWWSPHVRYQMGEEPVATPRDYEVENTGVALAGDNEGRN